MATVRTALIKRILKKGVTIANDDPLIKQLTKDTSGETMLFLIEDLAKQGGVYGFAVQNDKLVFVETPVLNQSYDLTAVMNENTFIHLLRGLDPEEAFWRGLIDITGQGWFKRVMLLRRFFAIGIERGLRKKTIGK